MSNVNPLLWLCGNCGNKQEHCSCENPKQFDLKSLACNALGRSTWVDPYLAYKRAVSNPAVVLAVLEEPHSISHEDWYAKCNLVEALQDKVYALESKLTALSECQKQKP